MDAHLGISQHPAQQLNDRFDFLKIIPVNEKAKLAFDNLAQNKQSLHPHHSQYIVVTGKQPLTPDIDSGVRSGGETPESVLSAGAESPMVNDGYYGIGFDRPVVLTSPRWILGRGSGKKHGDTRRVDILLANPAEKGATHGLAAAHALLKMHPVSGAWLLQAGMESRISHGTDSSKDSPQLKGLSMILNNVKIFDSDFRCLSKMRNTVNIAGLQYDIVFTIDSPEKEVRYRQERDAYLAKLNAPISEARITAIPCPKDNYVEWAFYRQGIGSGGHAAVFEGVDPLYGGLRAVKEITIKSKEGVPFVQQEVDAHIALAKIPGIVHLYGSSTSAIAADLDFDNFPAKAYLIMERGVSFTHFQWEEDTSMTWPLRMDLFRQLLEGLLSMHQREWMHRDITPQNLLLFLSEQRAVICDLGKAILAKTHTATNLAAWYFLPPELEEGKGHEYSHQLDIWMLALALLRTWWPTAFRRNSSSQKLRPRIPKEYSMICEILKRDKVSGFADLLLGMFERNLRFRYPISHVLKELRYRLPSLEAPENLDSVKRPRTTPDKEYIK